MLNPDQMTAWEQDGFFIVENLLSAEETELLGRIARDDVQLRADASVRDDGEGRAVSLRVRN
ncbi:MAG: phytanoyl-CoA dioxygenase family protein, partial [Planctomycetota bacterium]|nr:phytanoyl-CoA dioxygenase family protein [Planctomycetota bacterium]